MLVRAGGDDRKVDNSRRVTGVRMKVGERGNSDVYKSKKGGDSDVHNHHVDHHVDLELSHLGVERSKSKMKNQKNRCGGIDRRSGVLRKSPLPFAISFSFRLGYLAFR